MARLTISIPQELHDRLDGWRDRLNISRVCQEALEREVRRLEEVPTDAMALGALVERLSREKADGERQWFAQGVSDGMTWARGAAYADLRDLSESGSPSSAGGADDIERAMAAHAGVAGFDPDSYRAGWAFAAAEVWSRVKTKL
jgi:hypothetical protein